MGWRKGWPRLSYKMIPHAGLRFVTGAYELATLPLIYEVVRQMVAGSLDCGHLDAPDWSMGEIYSRLRPSGNWNQSPLLPTKHTGGCNK